MKPILETIIFAISVIGPVSIMLASAWLIYEQKDGWGWYLLAAIFIVGTMRIRFDCF